MGFLIDRFPIHFIDFEIEKPFSIDENVLIHTLADIIFKTHIEKKIQVEIRSIKEFWEKIQTFPDTHAMVIAGRLCAEIAKQFIHFETAKNDIPSELEIKKTFIFYEQDPDNPCKIEIRGAMLEALCRDFVFFKRLIQGPFREVNQSEIVLEIIDANQMRALIKFYNKGVAALKASELKHLMELSKRVSNFALQEIVEKYLKGISSLNLDELYQFFHLCQETHNLYIAKQALNELFRNKSKAYWIYLAKLIEEFSLGKFFSSAILDDFQGQFPDEVLKNFISHDIKKINFEIIKLNDNSNITNETLQFISCLPNLKLISLKNLKKIDDKGISSFANSQGLVSLWIDNCDVTDKGIQALASNLNLQSLQLHNLIKITDVSLNAFSKNSKLRDVGLKGCLNIENISFLESNHLPWLRYLDVSFCKHLTDSTLKVSLKKLYLYSLKIDNSGISAESLRKLKKIRSLHSLSIGSLQVSLEALNVITQLPFLRRLSLNKCFLTDQHFEALLKCRELQFLELEFCPVQDKHLQILEKLPHLQSLSLAGCKELTDQGMQGLMSKKEFRSINLYACNKVSNSCILELQSKGILVKMV